MRQFSKCRQARLLFALVIACSFVCLCHSLNADARGAQSAIAPSSKARKLFCWKLQGSKGTVYLLGSIHVGNQNFYPLPEEMENAFAQSEVVIGEIDQSREDPGQLRQLTAKCGMYDGQDQLSNHITKQTAQALDDYLKRSGMQASTFAHLRPWLASMTVMLSELQRQGFNADNGIDKHFMDEARQKKKPIGQLENAEFQLRLLSGFPEELQDKLLYSSLLDADKGKEYVDAMARAWQAGDMQGMERLITQDESQHPELKPLMQKVLYDRNQAMAQKIAGWLDRPHTYFVVVGAGHLVGDQGILKILQDQGHKVEQLRAS